MRAAFTGGRATAPEAEAEAAVVFAAMIARAHAIHGGDVIDLFATFVGMVVQEHDAIGLRCLGAIDRSIGGPGVARPPGADTDSSGGADSKRES